MSLHKLSAGSGYTYLTRQVAAGDVTARGRDSLGAYYEQRGEAPGVWLGAGLSSLDGGPRAGDPVTEAQMLALFGGGAHPNSPTTDTAVDGRPAAASRSVQLGAPFVTTGPRVSVAGYDLTFSPVKSVSAPPRPTSARGVVHGPEEGRPCRRAPARSPSCRLDARRTERSDSGRRDAPSRPLLISRRDDLSARSRAPRCRGCRLSWPSGSGHERNPYGHAAGTPDPMSADKVLNVLSGRHERAGQSGGRGIRTHDGCYPIAVFKTAAIGH